MDQIGGRPFTDEEYRELARQVAEHLQSMLPKPTLRERIADWLERMAYRVRNPD